MKTLKEKRAEKEALQYYDIKKVIKEINQISKGDWDLSCDETIKAVIERIGVTRWCTENRKMHDAYWIEGFSWPKSHLRKVGLTIQNNIRLARERACAQFTKPHEPLNPPQREKGGLGFWGILFLGFLFPWDWP